MTDEPTNTVQRNNIWKRGLLMLLFVVIYSVAEVVMLFIVLFQFIHILITDRENHRILQLGRSLSRYFYEIFCFMTFNSERLPFPFNPWPISSEISN